jgi:conjugative transposon TraK protein
MHSMFTKAKNIDTAFRQLRLFTMLIVACAFLTVAFSLYQNRMVVLQSQQRIFILANGKALEAFAADRKDNIPVEARDHVKTFHQLFFSLDPDEKVITGNITRALYLADGSAKKQYDNLKESGYYSSLVSGNISEQVEIDSVDINVNAYPYYFRCLAREKLIRTTSITTRSLVTEGYLRNVARSDNNPHGFLIEKWMVLENKDIKTEAR